MALPLLYLALRDVTWAEVGVVLGQAQYGYILGAILALTGSYLVRSQRWLGMLRAQIDASASNAFWATTVGYLGNTVLPARSGDLLRPFMVSSRSGSPRGFILATIITERVAEVALLTTVSLALLGQAAGAPEWLPDAAWGMAALALVGVLLLLTAPLLMPRLLAIASAIAWLAPLSTRAERPVAQLSQGMRVLHYPRRLLSFVVLTGLIWLLEMAYTVAIAQALSLQLTPVDGLLLLAALSLASALPSTPGYVGIFQFVAVTVMVPLGFSPAQALAYILVFQIVQLGTVLTLGGVGVWRLSSKLQLNWRRLLSQSRSEPGQAAE